jgi:hypothetical protein
MRYFQVSLFILALAAFVAALFFVGSGTGDTLWRAGIAALMLDIVCMMLWPKPK